MFILRHQKYTNLFDNLNIAFDMLTDRQFFVWILYLIVQDSHKNHSEIKKLFNLSSIKKLYYCTVLNHYYLMQIESVGYLRKETNETFV